MTFNDLYARPLIPQQFRCAGTWLVPLTLAHAEALDAMGLWMPQSPDELRSAAFICSRRWSDARRVLFGMFPRTRLHLWMLWRRNSTITGRDWSAWFQYVAHHREEAVVTFRSKQDSQPGTPWTTHLRVVATSRLGYSPADVGDVELARLVNEYHALSEMECASTVQRATKSEFRAVAAQMIERTKCQH